MANINLENIILQTIDIITSKKVAEAGYDRTIQATVISCLDPALGKYRVQYQDSYWIAYSNNSNIIYSTGSLVYILIPNGDMSKDKTILGTTEKLGKEYSLAMTDLDKYIIEGNYIVDYLDQINLCSYKTETKILYNNNSNQNVLNIDIDSVNLYFKNSNAIMISAYIKNNLDILQRYQGDYGILLSLDFLDSPTNNIITKYFIMNVDGMSGNPYYYPNQTKQYKFFEFDNTNFLRINTIALFTKDFLNQANNKPNDIFISNLQIGGYNTISLDSLDSYNLTLLTPKGYIFNSNSLNTDIRIILPLLRVKGKKVNLKTLKFSIYWFIENITITSKSPKYNKYGGQGWECLNPYNIIKQQVLDENGIVTSPAIIEYKSGQTILSVAKNLILTEKVKYKCVIVYNGNIYSKEISILRYDAQYKIFILSDSGTNFYYNKGNPTLTCYCQLRNELDELVNVNLNSLKFIWGVTNNSNSFESLPETGLNNENYVKLLSFKLALLLYLNLSLWLLYENNYDVQYVFPNDSRINGISDLTQKEQVIATKEKLIANGITSVQNIQTLLNKYSITTSSKTYNNILNSINNILDNNKNQRVYKNKIINLDISNINNFSTYKCSVFTKEGNYFLGTLTIVIKNNYNLQNGFTLVINNGNQVFKYNTHGVSPASKQNKIPYEIAPLSFSIYDNDGNIIEGKDILHCETIWKVPVLNSLLKIDSSYSGTPSSDLQDMIYKNINLLAYTIALNYNSNKTRNTILLKVNYNGINLVTNTNLVFTKEGNTGTNGTDYYCKVVPNVINGDIPLYPTIYYTGGSNISFNYITDTAKKIWFKALLWHNGNLPIYSGTLTGESTLGKTVNIISWLILKNKYSSTKSDNSNLKVNNNNYWSFSFNNLVLKNNYTNTAFEEWRPANIVKVTLTYDGMTYYGTLPVIIVRLWNTNYSIDLKLHTGFREVLFNNSGTQPEYDNHAPFELIIKRKLSNNRWEDVTNKISNNYKMGFDWFYVGSVWHKVQNSWEELYLRTLSDGNSSKKWLMKFNLYNDLKPNQKAIKPVDNYNGLCVNIALACRIYLYKSSATTIGWIHIPIHMLRNRFFNSAINGWDGNSVTLGDDNGGMILAPQVGAGIKDSNNRFTGVFIGTAKDPKEENSLNINNTNNNSQGRFAAIDELVGLFGYHEGSRSIFLDAKTGKAVFGKSKSGQIIIDPSNNLAIIQSGNYYDSATLGTGMQINLKLPYIKFGSRKFSVDKNGILIATDAIINGDALISGTIRVGGLLNSAILLYENTIGSNIAGGWDVNNFWLGGTSAENAKFKVSSEGILTAKRGSINLGEYLYDNIIVSKVIIDLDGIRIGPDYINGFNYNFNVSSQGEVIISKSITLGTQDENGTYPFYINNNGKGSINLGNGKFKVTDEGILTMKDGSILLGAYTYYDIDERVNVTVPLVLINSDKIQIGPNYNKTKKLLNYNIIANHSGELNIAKNISLGEKILVENINGTTVMRYPFRIDKDGKLDIYMQRGLIQLGNFKVNSNGILEANNAQISGTITIGGSGNGSIIVNNSSNKEIGRWNIGGISVYKTDGQTKVFNAFSNGTVEAYNCNLLGSITLGSIQSDYIKVSQSFIEGYNPNMLVTSMDLSAEYEDEYGVRSHDTVIENKVWGNIYLKTSGGEVWVQCSGFYVNGTRIA